jgi:alcohol dehydrogenase
MIALHLDGESVSIRNKPKPRRPKGHALLQLRAAGICNTDIELFRGYYGFTGTPGHEFVADVVEADDERWIGRRVVGEINAACGRCDWCRRKLERHCPKRTVLGIVKHSGAFAEYFTLPEDNLHAVSPSVPDAHAIFTEPVAAACEILDQVAIPAGAEVAVLGDGKLGLLIAQVFHSHGALVYLYGRHRDKLKIARRAGIATRITARPPRAKYAYAVEATGTPEGLAQAIAMTQPRGTVVMKSTVHGAVSLDTAPVIVNEISLVGSRCGRFEPALQLITSGRLRLDEMISAEFSLSDGPLAFAAAQSPGVLKVLLRP